MASKVATKVARPKLEGVRLFVSRLHWTVSSCEYCMAAAANLTRLEEYFTLIVICSLREEVLRKIRHSAVYMFIWPHHIMCLTSGLHVYCVCT